MKICPMYAIGDCPYATQRTDENGEFDCFCTLPHPEEDCDDYISMMEE